VDSAVCGALNRDARPSCDAENRTYETDNFNPSPVNRRVPLFFLYEPRCVLTATHESAVRTPEKKKPAPLCWFVLDRPKLSPYLKHMKIFKKKKAAFFPYQIQVNRSDTRQLHGDKNCIVGNVCTRFWQGRRMHRMLKERLYLLLPSHWKCGRLCFDRHVFIYLFVCVLFA